MNQSKFRFFLLLGIPLILFSTACKRDNVKFSQEFLNKKGSISLVWSANSTNGSVYQEGSQGLLDIAVTQLATASLFAKIRNIVVNPYVDDFYLKKFGNEFGKRQFNAKLVQLPLDSDSLQKSSSNEKKMFWIDFREFKSKYGAEYVLYLDIPKFGISREYFSFIPTSAPKGKSMIDIYLINTTDNLIESEYHDIRSIDVQGEWDTPPEYSPVKDAAITSLKSSLEAAFVTLFAVEEIQK